MPRKDQLTPAEREKRNLKIAHLHYKEKLSLRVIAERFNLDMSRISTILKEMREKKK